MSDRRRRRVSLRTEAVVLLPVALLILIAVSALSLFSFRNAIASLVDERRGEAMRVARTLATAVVAGQGSGEQLRRVAPYARGIYVCDAEGAALVAIGDEAAPDLLRPLGGRFPTGPTAAGPSDALPGVVAGFAPFGSAAERRVVRVDLGAASLDSQQRALAGLTALVVVIYAALAVLLTSFLRHALRPYDTLLAQARRLGGPEEGRDEVEFMVETFGRALQALAREGSAPPTDAVAALERVLAPNLETGLLLFDSAGTVLALNVAGTRLLAVEPPPPGTTLTALLGQQRELLVLLERCMASGQSVQRAEVGLASPPDSVEPSVLLGLTVHPLRRDDGAIRGFLTLFADLTEARRREQESRLADSLQRIGELAAGVAHELRNGLASLRGYLTLIARRPPEDEVQDYLGEIRHETDHLQRVVEDFLAFARPGSARIEDVDLTFVVRRAAADPALSGSPMRLELPSGACPTLRGDPQLLERGIKNLLHNAAQAQTAAGADEPVVVRLLLRPRGFELTISDRGPGVPEGIRERLFQPFVSGRPGGVGLGLALTHRIIDLHGGSIRLEPRDGGGTVARVEFPRNGAPASS